MFDAHLAFRAKMQPRALAVLTPRLRVDYARFDADVSRLAGALPALGLSRGQVVSIAISGHYLQCLALMALGRAGIASSPSYDPAADVQLTDHESAAAPGSTRVVRLARADIDAILAGPVPTLPRPDLDPLSTGRVMLSSGTTRTPRRVALTWRRIQAGIDAAIVTYAQDKRGVWLPLTGLESMMGHSQALSAWALGAAVLPDAAPRDLPMWMESLDSGIVCLTPAQLREALASIPPGFTPRPGWRLTVGGSALPAPVAREARLRMTPDIRIIYGATEAGLSATADAAELETTPDLLGHSPPGAEVRIVDEAGQVVPDGEPGELHIRGQRVASGYIGDPEATAERFRDGWFLSRDLGRRLPDGRLVMEGRLDDRMDVEGRKFMPSLLEQPALTCPGIVDAAAFAAPDAAGLDRVWLAVVAAPGFHRDDLAAHLAAFPGLPPRRFAWIDEVPRNAMGKVERRRLRELLLAATRGHGGA